MTTGRQKFPDCHQESACSRAGDRPMVNDSFAFHDMSINNPLPFLMISANSTAKECAETFQDPRIFLGDRSLNQSNTFPIGTHEPVARDRSLALPDASGPTDHLYAGMFGGFGTGFSVASHVMCAAHSDAEILSLNTSARREIVQSVASANDFCATYATATQSSTAVNPSEILNDCEMTDYLSDVIDRGILVSFGCWHFLPLTSSNQLNLCVRECQ